MNLDEFELKSSTDFWLFSSSGYGLYRTVIILFVCILVSLFLIHVDISVVARGVIRPMAERSEIRSPAGGIIDSIYHQEGDMVFKNSILIKIRNPAAQVCSPVSGSLLKQYDHNVGNHIQAGELICSISPNGQLIGECYVPSKSLGLIKIGQPVKFQVDAYNYNYFGTGSGRIYFIDNDYVLLDKTPLYRVRFQLKEKVLKLSNGFSGEIKKGMQLQARFRVCNRTLWQLLYEKIDDWVNPIHQ